MKPVSLNERSTHERLIWLVEAAVAARLDGAIGRDWGVNAAATIADDWPAVLNAVSR